MNSEDAIRLLTDVQLSSSAVDSVAMVSDFSVLDSVGLCAPWMQGLTQPLTLEVPNLSDTNQPPKQAKVNKRHKGTKITNIAEAGNKTDAKFIPKPGVGRYMRKAETEEQLSRSRHNRRKGVKAKLEQLKEATGDEAIVIFRKLNFRSAVSYNYWSTNDALFEDAIATCIRKKAKKQPKRAAPCNDQLMRASPSRPSEPLRVNGKRMCIECGLVEGSTVEVRWESGWMKCKVSGCQNSVHLKCIGLEIMSESVIQFSCQIHRPSAPKPLLK